jgi:hypothetical protein
MRLSIRARAWLTVAAAVVVPVGVVSVSLQSAGASTAACGSECTSPSVESLGTGEVLTAEGSSVGSGVKLAAASTSDTTQDWTVMPEYGVVNAAAAGVVSRSLTMMYGQSYLVEFQYAPGGDPSDLCVANTASDPLASGGGNDYYETPTLSVALEPCGVTAQSLWIIDQNCANTAYCDLINAGYETQYTYEAPADADGNTAAGDMLTSPFAEPMVLTSSSSGALSLAPLSELSDSPPPADQAWGAYTAPAQSALRAALRKLSQKARNLLP